MRSWSLSTARLRVCTGRWLMGGPIMVAIYEKMAGRGPLGHGPARSAGGAGPLMRGGLSAAA